MAKNKEKQLVEFDNLSGAPPWYVAQYEPDPEAEFPLPGFITNDLPSPFPTPNSAPKKKRKTPQLGNLLQLVGALAVFVWAMGFIVGNNEPPGLNRSYKSDFTGRYVYVGVEAYSTPVPEPVPFTPVPTQYYTPMPQIHGTPAWYRDPDTGAIVYQIATPTPVSSFLDSFEPTAVATLTDRQLGMEGVEPVQFP